MTGDGFAVRGRYDPQAITRVATRSPGVSGVPSKDGWYKLAYGWMVQIGMLSHKVVL